ncbi:hypothetical protein [Pseudaestuariivita sp.]|uniref:hypothetical protein n=1 Tax=Pseudaestuariivita sp. TaxID=2211669 RepID=UPI0040590736
MTTGLSVIDPNLVPAGGLPYWVEAFAPVRRFGSGDEVTKAEVVTYGFVTSGLTPLNEPLRNPTEVERDSIRGQLEELAKFSGISFVEVPEDEAQMRMAVSNVEDATAFGRAWQYTQIPVFVVAYDSVYTAPRTLAENTYIYVHEALHGVGFKHSTEAFGSTHSVVIPEEEETGTTLFGRWTSAWDGGLQLFDIAAMQYLYGVDETLRTGDDTYVPILGAYDPQTKANDPLLWDGAGHDVIDLSSAQGAVNAGLLPGKLYQVNTTSELILDPGTFSINFGSQFEELIASDFSDTLLGSFVDDTIRGGSGNDTITSGSGHDMVYGQAGFDRIVTQTGNDTVVGGNGRDFVELGSGDDLFQDNPQSGLSGSDRVFGDDGNDTFQGGGGNDQFYGQNGDDLILGRQGNDSVYGGAGDDTIRTGAGNDVTFGGKGADLVYLNAGDDSFFDTGEGVADTVYAGRGDDYVQGGGGADVLYGQLGDDVIYGRNGSDKIYAAAGSDTIFGGAGNDVMFAGAGTDSVEMGNGADTFFDTDQGGAAGSDTITGGFGADRFVFNGATGADEITDFQVGIDTLRIASASVGGRSAAQVVSDLASLTADGAEIDMGGGNVITLDGVTSLSALASDIEIF